MRVSASFSSGLPSQALPVTQAPRFGGAYSRKWKMSHDERWYEVATAPTRQQPPPQSASPASSQGRKPGLGTGSWLVVLSLAGAIADTLTGGGTRSTPPSQPVKAAALTSEQVALPAPPDSTQIPNTTQAIYTFLSGLMDTSSSNQSNYLMAISRALLESRSTDIQQVEQDFAYLLAITHYWGWQQSNPLQMSAETARQYGPNGPESIETTISALAQSPYEGMVRGHRHWQDLLRRFQGDPHQALLAWYLGAEAVEAGRSSPNAERFAEQVGAFAQAVVNKDGTQLKAQLTKDQASAAFYEVPNRAEAVAGQFKGKNIQAITADDITAEELQQLFDGKPSPHGGIIYFPVEHAEEILKISSTLDINPIGQALIEYLESGFNTDLPNKNSGCVGRIQWCMPETLPYFSRRGIQRQDAWNEISAMTFAQQSELIIQYYQYFKAQGTHNIGDLYLKVFSPAFVGYDDSYVAYVDTVQSGETYDLNTLYDYNKDGTITVGEMRWGIYSHAVKLGLMQPVGMSQAPSTGRSAVAMRSAPSHRQAVAPSRGALTVGATPVRREKPTRVGVKV